MLQGNFFILMLQIWTFMGRGVDGETVTGVLHGRVELRGRYGHSPDMRRVEWTKHSGSTSKLIYWFEKPNNTLCFQPCQNINFSLPNMSLILFNVTQEDEGIYEEKTIFINDTIITFNITLSVQLLSTTSPPASRITVSSSPGSLNATCENNNKTSNDSLEPSSFSKFIFYHKHILLPAGLALIGLLVLCIVLICKYNDCRKTQTTSTAAEPVYDEPTYFQEATGTPNVDPLLIVYQDFIKPKDQSEDFGYSTIKDVLPNGEPLQTI